MTGKGGGGGGQQPIQRFVDKAPPVTPTLPLAMDVTEKLDELRQEQPLKGIMDAAFEFCQEKFKGKPQGKAVPIRTLAEVKKTVSKHVRPVFSGSLGQLDLKRTANDDFDAGRVINVLGRIKMIGDFVDEMGAIIVNVDLATSEADLFQRANCDAEIAAVCIAAHLHKDHTQELVEFAAILSDLKFEARCMGVGAQFMIGKLDLVSTEDDKRNATGMSSFRLCKYLVKISDQVRTEGLYSGKGTDADRLMACLEQNGMVRTWSPETVKRFLNIGRKCNVQQVQSIVEIGSSSGNETHILIKFQSCVMSYKAATRKKF